MLSYPHPDDDHPGIGEGNYGNMEDRNSQGAQSQIYTERQNTAEENPFKDSSRPANNPAEDGVASSNSSHMDMSNMSSMPENLPTPQKKTATSSPSPFAGDDNSNANEASRNQRITATGKEESPSMPQADENASNSWQNETFGGGNDANPYGNANFASKQESAESKGEDSPPPTHQSLGEIGDHTEGQAIVNGQKVAPQAYQKANSAPTPPPQPIAAPKKKLKIIPDNGGSDLPEKDDDDGAWKIVKR